MSNNTEPKVSVVIPAYRAENTIVETVKSVLKQTYTNWEAVIGSDDKVDYLRLLSQQGITDPRLKQAYTGGYGTGGSSARNTAATITNGEIIACLDADDAYEPNRLAELVPLVMKYGAAMDNTGVYNQYLVLYKCPFSDRTEVSFATHQDILKPRIPFFMLLRREFFGRGWTQLPFAQDVIFNLEILSRVGKVAIHPQLLYKYYKRENSITQSAKAFETAERSYNQILAMLDRGELELTPEIRAAAKQEFSENLLLNRLFRQYMEQGRCQNLEQFLDLTENGQADWLKPELAQVRAVS